MRPIVARRLTLPALAAAAAALASCRVDETTVPPGRDRLVVHAVLDPSVLEHVILIERTFTGAVGADTSRAYDSTDAIVSRGATPVSGATVVVVSETGDSAVAVEDLVARGDGKGAGMYRFRNEVRDPSPGDSSVAIVQGRRYELRIATAGGETVQGATVVPSAVPVRPATGFRPFDRERDSTFVYWDPVPGAARYALRIESPRGPFTLFVDSAEYLIAGTLRNTSVTNLPFVFVPGFVQRLTIGAVDRNYFDWYRSASDPYTGSGLITHLDGALGVFGSYVLVEADRLDVTAPLDDPLEGDYDRISPPLPNVPSRMRIYIESVDGDVIRLTGNWNSGALSPAPGLLGEQGPLRTTIALLAGQSARDTVEVLELRAEANRLQGQVRSTGQAVEFERRFR